MQQAACWLIRVVVAAVAVTKTVTSTGDMVVANDVVIVTTGVMVVAKAVVVITDDPARLLLPPKDCYEDDGNNGRGGHG